MLLLRKPLLLSLSTLTCGSHAALQDTHCKLSLIVLAVVGVAIAALLRSVQLCSVCSKPQPPKKLLTPQHGVCACPAFLPPLHRQARLDASVLPVLGELTGGAFTGGLAAACTVLCCIGIQFAGRKRRLPSGDKMEVTAVEEYETCGVGSTAGLDSSDLVRYALWPVQL